MHDACRHGGSDRSDCRYRVRVVRTALAIVGPEAHVRDSGEGTRPCRSLWSGNSCCCVGHTRTLDPAGGGPGAALLCDAVHIIPM